MKQTSSQYYILAKISPQYRQYNNVFQSAFNISVAHNSAELRFDVNLLKRVRRTCNLKNL
jgi:S-adenosylmethionine:tRNA-ribosyltransferase-isomerase (queuine synthetase)